VDNKGIVPLFLLMTLIACSCSPLRDLSIIQDPSNFLRFDISPHKKNIPSGGRLKVTLTLSNDWSQPVRICTDPGTFHFLGTSEIKSGPVFLVAHPSCWKVVRVPAGKQISWQDRTPVPLENPGPAEIISIIEVIYPAGCRGLSNCQSVSISDRAEINIQPNSQAIDMGQG
jgi:hypothetical protein